MEEHITQSGSRGGGERLVNAARCHPSLALNHVHLWSVYSESVKRRESKAD